VKRIIIPIAAALSAVAQDASFLETGGQIRSEIGRVRKIIADQPPATPDFASADKTVGDLLKHRAMRWTGMLYLGVERLAQAVNFANGVRTAGG